MTSNIILGAYGEVLAITTKRDSNGDRARIILGRGTSYRSHADNVTFNIIEPNLEILKLQWTFLEVNDFLTIGEEIGILDTTQSYMLTFNNSKEDLKTFQLG